ncbi:tryptophan repeat gene family protein [Betaentomopoxvirus amoorei]|uniref:AMV254 n=1 Tax=Amsacta moorei entomopoxvirus TaxID=28321 RepID=Q9EMF2_AMEPV|nr:tryptophan repeat gene family protein [Amsacta moorei entomopoxvirus]AAG02960.1 AMV254 [Amsacta moorei entomopoxvirus]
MDTLPSELLFKIFNNLDIIDLYNLYNIDFYTDVIYKIIIKKNKNEWKKLYKNYILTDKFIYEYKHYIDWFDLSYYSTLNEYFIIKYKKNINWINISETQILSENFIRLYKNKVYWNNISKYQKLSEKFILEFKNYVNWNYIFKYQKLTNKFIRLNIFQNKYYSYIIKKNESFIFEPNLEILYKKYNMRYIYLKYTSLIKYKNITNFRDNNQTSFL